MTSLCKSPLQQCTPAPITTTNWNGEETKMLSQLQPSHHATTPWTLQIFYNHKPPKPGQAQSPGTNRSFKKPPNSLCLDVKKHGGHLTTDSEPWISWYCYVFTFTFLTFCQFACSPRKTHYMIVWPGRYQPHWSPVLFSPHWVTRTPTMNINLFHNQHFDTI